MKKISKCKNYYVFDSVEEVIEKVDVESYRNNFLIDYPYVGWSDFIEEDFITILKYFGFEEIETCWDVSYSQGSGASFIAEWYSDDMDLNKLKEYAPEDKELNEISEKLENLAAGEKEFYYARIKRFNHHYCHQNTVESECYDEEDNRLYDVDREFDDVVYDLSTWFFNKLQTEFDYLLSDKGIAEYIVANEIEIPEEYLK